MANECGYEEIAQFSDEIRTMKTGLSGDDSKNIYLLNNKIDNLVLEMSRM